MSQDIAITRANLPRSSVERGLGARAAFRAIGNEVYKGLLAAWGERVQILIELPLFIATALLFIAVIGKGEEIATGQVDWSVDGDQATWIFLGYVAFVFYYLQTAKLFWRLLGEIQTGTLEQVYLSPLPSWLVAAAGRVVAAVVETAFVVAAMYLTTDLVIDLEIKWRVQGLLPVLFLVAGAVGYSLVIGGMALVWKRIELINDGLFMVLFLFGGLVLPLDRLPDWAAAIARLFPITHAAESLRNVLLDGRSFTTMSGDGGLIFATGPITRGSDWSFTTMSGDGGLIWLTVTTVAWLLAGGLIFHLGEKTAKRRGSLSRY